MKEEYNNNNFPFKEEDQNNIPQNEMVSEEEKFFKDFTNEELDINDPSLGKDLIKIYEEEIPFEIRKEEDELSQNSSYESLFCKIMESQDKKKDYRILVEIGCDKDLFFYYSTMINSEEYEAIKKSQKLICDFNSFSDFLIQFFDDCINDTKKFLAVFIIQNDGKGKIELSENLGHKFVELINLTFDPASEDAIKNQIIYRYNSIRALEDIAQNRINIINNVLKEFDPKLIYEIKKEVSSIKVESYLKDKPLNEKP